MANIAQDDPVGSQQDSGNLTIMELTGAYDRDLTAPRQAVAAHFFATHPDQYDFIYVFTTFEFDTGNYLAFYNPIRNDTIGIGKAPFDNSASFGSNGKLQGYIDMAAISRYEFAPTASGYQLTLDTMAHETMHRWGAYVHFSDTANTDSPDLLGQDGAHWSYFLDTDASVMYGADWELQGDGKFHSVDVRHRYSPLDLYLAGFAAPSEVPPFTLIRNGDGGVSTDLPVLGAVSGGSGEPVTIDQVVAASGARVPAVADAQKNFSAAMILLKRPGENISPDQMLELERLRVRFQQQFVEMTDGRGIVRVFTQTRAASTAGPPTILQGSGTAATPPGVAAAVSWIEGKQKADGHWEDRPATAVRDTVAVVRMIAELDPTFAGLASARTWLGARTVGNLDQDAWKLLGTDSSSDASALAAAQDSHGGFALVPEFSSSAFDTAIVASALAHHDANAPSLAAALQLVGSQQNADGSYGIADRGRGRILSTLRAATLLASSNDSAFVSARQRAADWISTQQLGDGGIGVGNESALADTVETYSLLGTLQAETAVVEGTRGYVRQKQQTAGDWGGSIYLTATAALAYAHDQRANLTLASPPSATPAQPHDGEAVVLSATIANSGSVGAPATIVRWYDGDPDHGGTQIGADVPVPSLVSNSNATIHQTWDTTGRAGDHVIWLVIDAANAVDEGSEVDNRGSVAVTVSVASSLPDLVASAADFHFTPASVTTLPSSIHLDGLVHDIGAQSAAGVVVRLYAQSDLTHALSETTVDVLARGSAPVAMDFTATMAATLALVVRVDPDNAIVEASETNNDANLTLPFGQTLDLAVSAADIVPVQSAVRVGQNADFDVTIHNRGTVDSPPFVLHAEVGQGASTMTIFDAPIQIAAGQSRTQRVTWRALQTGTAQLRIVLDPSNQVVESDETNNAASFDFSIDALDQPDLTFVADSLQFAPTPGLQGQPLTASLGVRNLSSIATGSFRVALFASDPRGGAPALASTIVPGAAGSSDTPVSIAVSDLGLAGDQTLYVQIDADNQIAEIDETNNVVIGSLHVVSLPDLSISVADIALTPALPVPGQPVTAQVTVRNLGQQDAHGVVVRLVEGDAGTGTAVGADRTIDTLAAGATTVVEWDWTLGVVPGATQITAIADPADAIREGSEDNNFASLPFDVGDGNFFANRRYISPNGDGVQDDTAVVFAMPVAGAAEVDVVNGAQYTVRHFTNVALNEAQHGQIVWDGRDDRGRIVPDGDYHFIAIDAAGQSHTGPLVTVDDNASSLLEAVGTPYGVYADLPNATSLTIPPITSPLRDQLFGLFNMPGQGIGLYREDTAFPNPIPVVSGAWLATFRQAQHLSSASITTYVFSPDGRNVLVAVTSSNGYWLVTTPVDQIDAPVIVAHLTNLSYPTIFGYLDESTAVIGPTSDQMLQRIDVSAMTAAPLRSLASMQTFPSQVFDVVPDGLLITGTDLTQEQLFLPRDPARAELPLNTLSDVDGDRDYTYTGALSPQRRTVAVYEINKQTEKIDLVDLSTGARRTLFQNAPMIVTGAYTGEQRTVPRYQVGWLEKQDELLIEDPVARTATLFSETGQPLSSLALPPLQRVGQYLIHGQDHVNYPSDSDHIFPHATAFDRIACADALNNVDVGNERRIFDPSRSALMLAYGERIIHEELNEGYEFVTDEGIVDDFSADAFAGTVTGVQQGTLTPFANPADVEPHPLRTACVDSPPADWPGIVLADGARIRSDGRVQTLSRGILSKTWPPANNQIYRLWPDETRVQLNSQLFSSLLNLSATLQARTLGRGIELSGLAADRNFAFYQLDWAPIEQPNDWRVLTPPSSDEVFADEFLTWVPPQTGTFLLRLTVVDKAGNRTTSIASATAFSSASMDSFSLSPRYISPNGDGVQDELIVKYRVLQPLTLDIVVSDASGTPVRSTSISYGGPELGPHEFDWDGRDDHGAVVPDGRYRVDVGGFAAWINVDTTAPVVAGELQQSYQPGQWCESPDGPCHRSAVSVPIVFFAVNDANVDELVIEAAPKGGGAWRTVIDSRGVESVNVADRSKWGAYWYAPDLDFGDSTLRVRAIDRAGNSATQTLGDGDAQLILKGTKLPRGDESLFDYQPPPVTDPLATAGLKPVELDQTAQLLLEWYASTRTLTTIAIETAPLDTPDQWTQRSSAPIGALNCPDLGACTIGWDTTALPVGQPSLVRLRGERADGSRIYSNQGYFLIGGIDPPSCASLVDGNKMLVYAAEHYLGPLAQATLHFGADQVLASEILDDHMLFIAPIYASTVASVEGVDSRGHHHFSPGGVLDCTVQNPPPPTMGAVVEIAALPLVARDQCDGQPGNKMVLGYNAHLGTVGSPSQVAVALPAHLQLIYTDGITLQPVVLHEETLTAIPADGSLRPFPFSTQNWPEGSYEGRLIATGPDGIAHTAVTSIPILKEAPQIAINAPSNGQRVCAARAPLTGAEILPV
ncbi:MAG TPA: CARDB domain-containing protein, partial [Rudaea sp.]